MGKSQGVQSSSSSARIMVRYWPLVLVGGLFITVQWPVLKDWWKIWNAPYSYFSHGPLVPFIAGYMVWANRKRLSDTLAKPSWIGFIVLVVSALLFVLARWTLSGSLNAVVFIMMLFAIIMSLLGPRITRLLFVPVAFLLSMIPLSSNLLDAATTKLQWQSAGLAAKLLTLTGYNSTLSGATVYSDYLPGPLIVGVPCSGLRTLISLLTFTVFFICLVRAQWWKKAILLAISFPLSLFINVLRIAMIGYAGIWTQSSDAMHKFHDYSGYLSLIICFFLLFGLAKLIGIRSFGISSDTNQVPAIQDSHRVVGGGIMGVLVCAVLAVTTYCNMHTSPIYPQTRGRLARADIPTQFGKWTGEDMSIDKTTRDWLKQADLLSRLYTNNSEYGTQMQVFISASRDPAGFHDPHMCIQGGGTPISGDKIVTLHFDKPFKTTVKATLLHTTSDYGDGLVMYWYMFDRENMPRTSDVWKKNRDNLWHDAIRLILHPWDKPAIKSEVEARQFKWYRFSTQIIEDDETDLERLKKFATDFVAHVKNFGEMKS
ncbi:exosortase [bacterium]|nr:exosortase [bacterium]